MTIAKRLLLLIAVACIGLIAVGAFSLHKMASINGNLEYANNKSIPALRQLESIESSFLRFRIMYMTLNFVATEEQKPTVQKGLDKARDDLDKAVKDYEALVLNEKDRGYFDATKAVLAEYYGIIDKSTAMMKANQVDQAKALSASAREASGRLTASIGEHSKFHSELAAAQAQSGADAFKAGWIEDVVIILLIASATAGFGLMTYRHVSSSLNEMNLAIEDISANLNFTRRIPVKQSDEVGKTITAFNQLLDRLQQSLRDILGKTNAVNTAAEKVATAAEQMSVTSVQQSDAASHMAATMEEMTVSINHVADRAGDADNLSRTSGQRANEGTRIIEGTVTEINGIAESVAAAAEHISRLEQNSDRINSVLSVIKEVADQTNLLALNAAIEAARAGEQGRGFAVVADEVRKLAERTTQSTQEISATIDEMQTGARHAVDGIKAVVAKTDSGVTQAEKANIAIRGIGESSLETVEMVGEISSAIREQSEASTAIAQQVERIAQMAEENSAVSHATSQTASELAHLVRDTQAVVAQYRV